MRILEDVITGKKILRSINGRTPSNQGHWVTIHEKRTGAMLETFARDEELDMIQQLNAVKGMKARKQLLDVVLKYGEMMRDEALTEAAEEAAGASI